MSNLSDKITTPPNVRRLAGTLLALTIVFALTWLAWLFTSKVNGAKLPFGLQIGRASCRERV